MSLDRASRRALRRSSPMKAMIEEINHLREHNAALSLFLRGAPMKVVQELLGHRTYRTTADVYSHVSETMQRQAVDVLSRVVGE